jgi:hypothetical protein
MGQYTCCHVGNYSRVFAQDIRFFTIKYGVMCSLVAFTYRYGQINDDIKAGRRVSRSRIKSSVTV